MRIFSVHRTLILLNPAPFFPRQTPVGAGGSAAERQHRQWRPLAHPDGLVVAARHPPLPVAINRDRQDATGVPPCRHAAAVVRMRPACPHLAAESQHVTALQTGPI